MNRLTSSLGSTKGVQENIKGNIGSRKYHLETLDESVMTDMKLENSDSDSSDLELDGDFDKKRLLSEESCDMEFESMKSTSGASTSAASLLSGDPDSQQPADSSSDSLTASGQSQQKRNAKFMKSKALLKSQKQIDKQNELITDAMRIGLDTHHLSQQANIELRSQRD